MKIKGNNIKTNSVEIYDTTLRDGTQGEGFSLSTDDKLMIADILDELGVDYIEGGFPSSNPGDKKFFQLISKGRLKHAKPVAFGSTRRKNNPAAKDHGLLILCNTPVEWAAIFGKSWDLHVREVLKASLEENLGIISDSISFLKKEGKKVFFDAEHFFDGFKNNEEYAVKSLKAALDAGAEKVVLCDTNGGLLPHEITNTVERLKSFYKIDPLKLGIHTHNDSDCAVANTIAAVNCGVRHVQGTINGYGERTGNANLSSIIPNLELKLHLDAIGKQKLHNLAKLSRIVDEISNNIPANKMPYVGDSAFTHKAGMHADAVLKNPESYEHISPSSVGNKRRFLISSLSGKGNIAAKAKELGLDTGALTLENEVKLLKKIKSDEEKGYSYESADASFKLLFDRYLSQYANKTKYVTGKALDYVNNYFDLISYRINVEKKSRTKIFSEAVVMIKVNGKEEHSVAAGDGPVNALDNALRKALVRFYPVLDEMKLTDFKVRVINDRTRTGTASYVRVLIESSDKKDKWSTIGVSENIIEASYQALADSINYKLDKDGIKINPEPKNTAKKKRK